MLLNSGYWPEWSIKSWCYWSSVGWAVMLQLIVWCKYHCYKILYYTSLAHKISQTALAANMHFVPSLISPYVYCISLCIFKFQWFFLQNFIFQRSYDFIKSRNVDKFTTESCVDLNTKCYKYFAEMKQRSGARIVLMNKEKAHTHTKALLSKLHHSMDNIWANLTT